MISERQFSNTFTSFWREAVPMLDAFWRTQNLAAERFCEPLNTDGNRQIRGVINELAFEVFCRRSALPEAKLSKLAAIKLAEEALPKVVQYINRFITTSPIRPEEVSPAEIAEALTLTKRLLEYFREYEPSKDVMFRPKFFGCGMIGSCEGDLLAGKTLYEIKSGNRSFRVVDIRQLIIYCALNRPRNAYNIENLGLVNPRVGLYWVRDVESISRAISGKSAAELLDELVAYFSAPAPYPEPEPINRP
jgi:hypothetical protein